MTCKVLTLIRHGESIANAGVRSSDPETIELTDRGREQSNLAASRIRDKPGIIVVSRMLRSRQSAESIVQRFPDVAVDTWPIHEFIFMNFKEDVAKTAEERKPLVDAYWARRDPYETNLCAESFHDFWGRVVSFHTLVSGAPMGSIVAVSHGFFMRAFAYGVCHQFPSCTRELMGKIHKESISNPIQNSEAFHFEIPADISVRNSQHGPA